MHDSNRLEMLTQAHSKPSRGIMIPLVLPNGDMLRAYGPRLEGDVIRLEIECPLPGASIILESEMAIPDYTQAVLRSREVVKNSGDY